MKTQLESLLRSRPAAVGIVAVTVLASVLLARETGRLMSFELWAYDRMRVAATPRGSSERVLLVSIGESEIQRYGHPLPDLLLTRALRHLIAQEPRAIGVDLYRTAPTPAGSAGFEALAEVAASHANVVFVELSPGSDGNAIAPPPFLARGDQVGLADVLLDPDGVTRRLALIQWDDAGPAFSLSLQLARHYLAPEGLGLGEAPDAPETLQLGAAALPPLEPDDGGYRDADASGYQILLDYALGDAPLPRVTLSTLLDGGVPPEQIRDRVVLIGTDSPTVKDDILTPFSGAEGDKGFSIHARAVDQLLRLALGESTVVEVVSEATAIGWIALWCLLGAGLPLAYRNLASAIGVTLAGGLVAAACSTALLRYGLWLPPGAPLLGWLAGSGLSIAWLSQRSRRERALVMDLFGRYASTPVAEQLWSRRDDFLEGGRPRPQRQIVTALLSDLKGYTQTAEKMDPYELMAWINDCMDAMTQRIEQHAGHVDDYVGDGIKANFGVPIPSTSQEEIADDAQRAVRCALAMGDALAALNAGWRATAKPTGRMRIGIFTGPVVVGSIGSATRLKYTSVGDTVNSAARLEAFSKDRFDEESEEQVCRILVSESTRSLLGPEFESTFEGSHTLKGKDEPVRIYRILGLATGVAGPNAARDRTSSRSPRQPRGQELREPDGERVGPEASTPRGETS